jgi:hypothetical protein
MTRQETLQAVKRDLQTTDIFDWIDVHVNLSVTSEMISCLNHVQSNIKKRTFGNKRQLYTFPMRLGTSHLFPQDWQYIFQFIDLALSYDAVALDSLDEEVSVQQLLRHHLRNRNTVAQRVPPVVFPRNDVAESIWMDLVYNERIKDPQYFWRLERILNYLSINPCSSQPAHSIGMFLRNDEPGTTNPLILMNVKKSERRKRLKELADMEDDEIEAIRSQEQTSQQESKQQLEDTKSVTCAKVLLVLLYFMNEQPRDRLVRAYIRSIREKYGSKFVELLMFVLYIVHTRVGMFEAMALDVLQNEIAKNVVGMRLM